MFNDAEVQILERHLKLPVQSATNSSGTGLSAALPRELDGFNWGACLGSIPWALAHRLWGWVAVQILLLRLAPPGGLFIVALMSLALGFTGNDLAWKYNRWRDADHFRRIQGRWASLMITLAAAACWWLLALALWDCLFFRWIPLRHKL